MNISTYLHSFYKSLLFKYLRGQISTRIELEYQNALYDLRNTCGDIKVNLNGDMEIAIEELKTYKEEFIYNKEQKQLDEAKAVVNECEYVFNVVINKVKL